MLKLNGFKAAQGQSEPRQLCRGMKSSHCHASRMVFNPVYFAQVLLSVSGRDKVIQATHSRFTQLTCAANAKGERAVMSDRPADELKTYWGVGPREESEPFEPLFQRSLMHLRRKLTYPRPRDEPLRIHALA